jgi:thiol-disulfide isomerase/thioredoxin
VKFRSIIQFAGGIILVRVVVLLLPRRKGKDKSNLKSDYDRVWIIDQNQFSDVINNRNGRVLFVNVWATWCIPCIEEFPDLIKLQQAYEKKPVDFVSLNVNLIAEKDSLVIPFLEKENSNLDVYMADRDDVDALVDVIDKNWSGAVPVTFILDRHGKRKISIAGKRDYNFFRASIDSLLKAE